MNKNSAPDSGSTPSCSRTNPPRPSYPFRMSTGCRYANTVHARPDASCRFTKDGQLDATFGAGGTATLAVSPGDDGINSLRVLPDDTIVATGVGDKNGQPWNVGEFAVAVLDADGAPDGAFNGTGFASADDLPTGVSRLVVVPELREVRVQISFSRFTALNPDLQGEFNFTDPKARQAQARPAVLTLPTGNEKWLPAAEVSGEGIFFELDLEAVVEWEERKEVQARAQTLLNAFNADGPGGEFPGVRFYLLHSLAHLLLTAISLECGYAASSIRERIYCDPIPGKNSMAGILLTTGTTGSEGTLGGLVEEGRRLRHHLREAWDLGRLCSNDPVCATHDPASEAGDRRLEGAACHGCLYIAESSCERYNRYLDRALVVPTIGNDPRLAYFAERP